MKTTIGQDKLVALIKHTNALIAELDTLVRTAQAEAEAGRLDDILADLSDESPELYAYTHIEGGEPHIFISVGGNGNAFAQASLPVSKLDLHCIQDAKIEYSHPDGPLPDYATPAQLESRAQTLRCLEGRIERALNRIAVAEECGFLQPN